MKILRTVGLIFSKIFLVIFIMLFFISLSTSYMLENGISGLLVNGLPKVNQNIQYRQVVSPEQAAEVDYSDVYNEISKELGITEEQLIVILESDVAKELINEFIDTVLEDISTGDASDFDLGEKVMDFVEDNKVEIEGLIAQPLPMDKIEDFVESEEINQFNDQYKETISTFNSTVPESIKTAIKVVEGFISEDFRECCLMISALLIIIVALLQWSFYKWIRTLGNTVLGCGIFVFIINLLGNIFASAISTMFNLNGLLKFEKSLTASAIFVGIGVVLLIVYIIVKKIVGKTKVSQNV